MNREFNFDKIELDISNFENKIIDSIEKAIKTNSEYANSELEWLGGNKLKEISSHQVMSYYLFSPEQPNNIQKTVSETYCKISDKYWKEKKIGLFFSGRDGGSNISIENTNNKESMKQYLEENQDNKKKILKRCLMKLAGMNTNDIEEINLKGISMIGMHWPFVMRSISDELEPHGTIVLNNGRYQLKCLKD